MQARVGGRARRGLRIRSSCCALRSYYEVKQSDGVLRPRRQLQRRLRRSLVLVGIRPRESRPVYVGAGVVAALEEAVGVDSSHDGVMTVV